MRAYFFIFLFLFGSLSAISQSIPTVRIYKQLWAEKNLSVSKFQNGDDIPEAKTKQEWISAFENKRPAWCSYRNSSKNDSVFGKIYNWYAISDSRGICPPGFLIPTPQDWYILQYNLNMDTATGNPFIAAAKRMKSKTGWFENGNGPNYSRLNCKPGGVRLNDGSFTGYGRQIGYWSILPESIDTPTSTHAYRTPYYLVEFHAIDLIVSEDPEMNGFYVRCIRQ